MPVSFCALRSAVAGFTRDELEITLEDKQLTVRGKQQDDKKPRLSLSRDRFSAVFADFRARRRY